MSPENAPAPCPPSNDGPPNPGRLELSQVRHSLVIYANYAFIIICNYFCNIPTFSGFYLKSSWIFYALIVGVVVTLLSKGLDLTTPTNGKNTSLSTSTELMDPRTEGSHLSRSDLLEIIQSELKELIWIEISDTLRTEMIPVIREEITPLIRTQVEGTLRSELAPLIRKEMQDTLRIQFQPSPVPPKWNNAKDKKPKDQKLKAKAVIEDDIVIFFATLFLGSLFGVGILVGKVGIRKSSWAVYGK